MTSEMQYVVDRIMSNEENEDIGLNKFFDIVSKLLFALSMERGFAEMLNQPFSDEEETMYQGCCQLMDYWNNFRYSLMAKKLNVSVHVIKEWLKEATKNDLKQRLDEITMDNITLNDILTFAEIVRDEE